MQQQHQQQRPPQQRPQQQQVPPAEPIVVLATKYDFDLQRKDWIEHQTKIRVSNANKHFEAGGMRVCFEVEEIEDDGCSTPCVAKMFKKDIPDVVKVDYFNEAMAQCLSDEFAQNFNRLDTPKKISFLMCNVVKIDTSYIPQQYARNGFFSFRTQDTKEVMFCMEPKFRGVFTKYNNNFGETYDAGKEGGTQSYINRRKEVYKAAEAFSHFTLQESGGSMLVCDLQGVEDFFTDPQIHTEDGKGLGMGNMGEEGIQKWRDKHKCNEICQRLSLRSFNEPPPVASSPNGGGGGGGGGAPPLASQAQHFQKQVQGQPQAYPQFATAQVFQPGFNPPNQQQQPQPNQQPQPQPQQQQHYNQFYQQMRNSIHERGVDVNQQRTAPPPRPGGPPQPNYNAKQPAAAGYPPQQVPAHQQQFAMATQPSPNAPPPFMAPSHTAGAAPVYYQQQQQPQQMHHQQQQYRPPQQQPLQQQQQPRPQQQPQQYQQHQYQQYRPAPVPHQPVYQQQPAAQQPQPQQPPQATNSPTTSSGPSSPGGSGNRNKPVNQMTEEEQLAYAMQLSKIQR